jgi:hypothetical protein
MADKKSRMLFPLARRALKRWWDRLSVRILVALLVTAAVAYFQYRLTKIPLPIDLEATNRFKLPDLLLGQSMLIINGPLKSSTQSTLISHDGRVNELVSLRLDRGHLAAATVEDLKSNDSYSPAASAEGPIRYTNENPQSGQEKKGEPCRTNFRIDVPLNQQPPTELRFFQLTPGLQRERQIEIQASDEILVTIEPVAGENNDIEAQGCKKLLEVNNWSQPMGPGVIVSAVAAPNYAFRFSFTPMQETNTLWTTAGFYDPLDLGVSQEKLSDPPPVIRAAAISIRTVDGRTLFSAWRASDETFVQLNKLEIGSDKLQANLSGRGFVTLNDEVITLGLFERIEDYKVIAALLGLANAAIVGWITRIIRKRPALTKP